ncbi:LRR receptor-like serine/threonine-protein kinase RGI5 [Capsicum annuum]|uniref:LRR receptor-like serine/threonine-protein kinase RGI5 n=1 Tax=Capsicum annuum TaxID=4072 RepID=UPI001FB16D54|nr:LRR receptor-like serine/threonine-protein kinase RGI5 [Capsicum annuum]
MGYTRHEQHVYPEAIFKGRYRCYLKSLNNNFIGHNKFLVIYAIMEKAFTSFLLTSLLLHYVMASSGMTKTNITTDQLALFTLKSQIVSDPFHFLDESWSFTTSVCHWVGVTCGSHHQRVNSLNLNFNSIEGQIPKVIGNLRELKLRGNNLIGSIPLSLSNASRLETLDISYNSLQRNIPEEIGNLHNMKVLSIQDNQLTGSIPFIIFNISRIEVIAFSGNSFSGYLPYGLCNGLPTLKGLYLWKNKLCDHMPTSLSNYSQLQILALPDNEFGGPMHSEFGGLINLKILELGMNRLTGPKLTTLALYLNPLNRILPSSAGNLSTSLRTFVAYSCKIKGRIPNEFGNLSSLLDLNLLANSLAGSIPTTIGNLRNLQRFNLSNNKLKGFIGDHICKLQHLGDIYLGRNQLSGSLPNCLGNITILREIHLGSNKLSSNIPPSLGNILDLVVFDLSSNNMAGSLPLEIGNLKAVTLIDLSMNKFSNRIPREIGGLQNLAHLSLRRNKLQGAIPDSMRNTVSLEFLDLSHNNISGIIPKFLEKLQNLKYFNVSFNKLYGETPSGGPLKNLSSQFFIYNEALCGSSSFGVPPCPTSSKHRSNSDSNRIGSGSFGSVYKGVLRSGTAIAFKVFNLQLDAAFKSFDTECEVLCSLRHRIIS